MAEIGTLHTINENHSVKEAVISFSLLPSISSPKSYKRLVEAGGALSGFYHKYEPVKSVEVKMDVGTLKTQITSEKTDGFKLIRFENGDTTEIIQGLNQNGNGLFTFNTVAYTSWGDFKNRTIESAKKIHEIDKSYRVFSFSLLYIDEFFFPKEREYNPRLLFNENSKELPNSFFSSSIIDYNLVLEKEKDGRIFQEKLTIKVFNDHEEQKRVHIIDNIAFLITPISFGDLINSKDLSKDLEIAHVENKSMLIDILNDNLATTIGLKKNS